MGTLVGAVMPVESRVLARDYFGSDWGTREGSVMSVKVDYGLDTTTQTDDHLTARVKAGDMVAFDRLVERYQARLYGFAFRILHDANEAEDAVQETFLRAYRAMHAYRPTGFFSSWIYRITLNECRRRIRSRKPQSPLGLAENLVSPSDPQRTVLLSERHRMVRSAVDSLPVHYREVMCLFYFDDMSVDQISKILTVSVSAVKVRLHRGREKLSVILNGKL